MKPSKERYLYRNQNHVEILLKLNGNERRIIIAQLKGTPNYNIPHAHCCSISVSYYGMFRFLVKLHTAKLTRDDQVLLKQCAYSLTIPYDCLYILTNMNARLASHRNLQGFMYTLCM